MEFGAGMVRLFVYLLVFMGFLVSPAMAEEDLAPYLVEDVQVDVSAETAAAARDQAIIQAQRDAFHELLQRLGTEDRDPPTTDEVIASLVQAFEIKKEHARGERYTGTLSVQFRPTSVRELFGLWGSDFVDERAAPVVILPVWLSQGHATMWEQETPWKTAWDNIHKESGLVPLIIPAGDLEDVSKISTQEALEGKKEALMQIMEKYHAGGVLVIAVDYDPLIATEHKARLFMAHYDKDGVVEGEAVKWVQDLSATDDMAVALGEAAQHVVERVEKGWRSEQKLPSGHPVFLPVDVYVETLADWANIREKMREVPLITDTHVVTMRRGLVHIELEFRGEIPLLIEALRGKGLSFVQTQSGSWAIYTER